MNISAASQAAIEMAARLLQQGKLVALPTETVYGLGADAKNPSAVQRIFAAKGRPADHPLIVHLAEYSQLADWAVNIPEAAYNLAEHFWPGPLTLVLKKHPDVPYEVTGGQNTVALRVPNHPVALAVLKAFGGGIAAPSANRFCRISPTQASHVVEELGDKVDMILDGGTCQVGLESTIVDLSGIHPRLLRPGQISKTQIEEVLGTELEIPGKELKISAPGCMDLHYSPATPAFLCDKAQMVAAQNGNLFTHAVHLGMLAFDSSVQADAASHLIVMPQNPYDYGAALYGCLRELDKPGLACILVEQPPQTDAWRAVNDRLNKAAQPLPKTGDAGVNGKFFEGTHHTLVRVDPLLARRN